MSTRQNKPGIKCNRKACNCKEAFYWNRVTEAYYCQSCAIRINLSSKQSGLGELCTLVQEDREAWVKMRSLRRNGSGRQ